VARSFQLYSVFAFGFGLIAFGCILYLLSALCLSLSAVFCICFKL
jgi:hypothetical protein